jgi:hypothetical protein
MLIVISIFSIKPLSAQVTDNPVTLGGGDPGELQIKILTGG